MNTQPQPTPQPPATPKPYTARDIWQAYVEMYWSGSTEVPLGRRGMMMTVSNPKKHLADGLHYKSYSNGRYVIECRDHHLAEWARVKLCNLGREISIFARRYGLERDVTVEFVTKPEPEKF